MAEAIALDYVHRKGLEDRVEICSSASGLSDKTIAQGEEYVKQQLGIVELALKNGIYQETWRQREAEEVLAEGRTAFDARMLFGNRLYSKTKNPDSFRKVDFVLGDRVVEYKNYAVNMEAHFRNVALMESGLFAGGKYHKPTVARHNGLILPMAESNAKQVRTIYEGASLTPTIQHLNAFAGVEGDVPNPFCQLLPAYQASRDHLMKVVPMSIEKAMNEYL